MSDKIEFDDLFKSYAPSQDGLERLCKKLDDSKRKKDLFSLPGLSIASVSVIAIMFTVIFTGNPPEPEDNLFLNLVRNSENPVFIKYGYLEKNNEPVSIPEKSRSRLAAMRLETLDKNVKFYLLESND